MSVLIENVRLWDGTGAASQPRMAVEMRDGHFAWIGPAADWPGKRANLAVVDGTARTLIPGLVDCHVHYSSPGGPDWIARFSDAPQAITLRAVELAGQSLRSGVTSAREVGARDGLNIRLAHAAAAGDFLAPHLHAAGTWIAHQGTYVPFARHFGDAAALRAAIAEEVDAGADLIKVALDQWNPDKRPEGAPTIPFDAALLAVAVEAAHAAGLTVACHANDAESCRIAARAGVDSLEHGMFLEADDLAAMAANGTVLVPTLSVWDDWLFYAREVGWPEARRTRAEGLREASRAAMASAIRQGVAIAAGTDAGGGSVRHGRIAREVELMVECGMDPAAALMAATRGGAALMGELAARGTIEVGKVADCVLLDRNPLEDPAALRLVAAVFQSGRCVA
ncbi:MAG TPA: amidohydrolase family protein [Ktedonobacterales bacterium]|nr:amidohydrolase family protein [Ktedonobacterales bacterium]